MVRQLSRNFSSREFECHHCGVCIINIAILDVLEALRADLGHKSVTINSGYRCPIHNFEEGGKADSQHLTGSAADVVIRGIHPNRVADYLELTYPHTHGIGRYNTFTHIDVRPEKARWDNRFTLS